MPDANEEYLFYQTLVGAWPMSMESEEERQEFVTRIQQYMEKALHEAKVNVSWINQNPAYVEALREFISAALSPTYHGKPNLFWDSLQKFMAPVIYFGALNSLTQTLLKLTSPGVPDIYQGQEMYDFSLVDPDNRRPVNFDLRASTLEHLAARADSADLIGLCEELLETYRDGRIKLWLTWRALEYRGSHPQLFRSGNYVPLRVQDDKREHVVAFARSHGEETAIVAAPRLAHTVMNGAQRPPLGAVWRKMAVVLPERVRGRQWRNIFTGEALTATTDNTLLCRELFAHFPVALLTLS